MDDVLAAVGLAAADQTVYESLIDGAATVAELERRTGFTGGELTAVLDRLEETRLARRPAGRPRRYAAAPPPVALAAPLLPHGGSPRTARRRGPPNPAGGPERGPR